MMTPSSVAAVTTNSVGTFAVSIARE